MMIVDAYGSQPELAVGFAARKFHFATGAA
jgi:hypothetical protein